MKVILANKFFFNNGGSETVLFQEREYLISRGVTVLDFSMQHERNLPSPTESYFVAQSTYGTNNSRSAGRALIDAKSFVHSHEACRNIRQLIDDYRPDLLHCHNIYHQLTPSIMHEANEAGVPVVLTLHDYKAICPSYLRLRHGQACSRCRDSGLLNCIGGRCGGSLSRSLLLFAEATFHKFRKSYTIPRLIIAPSQFLADSVAGYAFAPTRLRVIHNGIDVDAIRPTWQDQGFVLYIGRLSKEKGLDALGEADALLKHRHRIVIAGAGPEDARLRTQFPELEFAGYVSGDAREHLLQTASCIVMPSEWYENCPMTVLEAMGYGKPVIATTMGGLPELVEHHQTGVLVSPSKPEELAAAIDQIMASSHRRLEMGKRGRKKAEDDFSLARHNESIWNLYQEIVA